LGRAGHRKLLKTGDRPYRPAIGIDKALDEITKKKGVLYDTRVVGTCLRLFNEKRFKLDYEPMLVKK